MKHTVSMSLNLKALKLITSQGSWFQGTGEVDREPCIIENLYMRYPSIINLIVSSPNVLLIRTPRDSRDLYSLSAVRINRSNTNWIAIVGTSGGARGGRPSPLRHSSSPPTEGAKITKFLK